MAPAPEIDVRNSVASSGAAQRRNGTRLQRWFGCSSPVLIVYVAFCLALAAIAYLRPLPTFDRYLYAGAVASLRYSDPVTIHRVAREEFDVQPSPFPYKSILGDDGLYAIDLRDNPYHFVQDLG